MDEGSKPVMTPEQIDELERSGTLIHEDNGLHFGKGMLEALCNLARIGLAVQPRLIEEAPKDGTEVWLLNKTADAYLKLRWSTHYSVFGLGGCWTDGLCTMGDKIDFDWFIASLPSPTEVKP